MALLSLSKISKSFQQQQVLEDVTFEVKKGEKIGLVGSNGTGKTTVFRLILKELAPDSGTISRSKQLRVAYLPQNVQAEGAGALRDFVLSGCREINETQNKLKQVEEQLAAHPGDGALIEQLSELHHRFELQGGRRIGPECDRVLAGLGFAPAQHARPITQLSGGERTKAALAQVLLSNADLMLLDEPTNHLDIWASSWLEAYVKGSPAAAVCISHDRYFLNQVADTIVALSGRLSRRYPGNYESYLKQRAQQEKTLERRFEKQQEFIRKEEDFIRRYHAAQRGKEARGRLKKLEKIERIEKPQTEKTLSISFQRTTEQGRKIIRFNDVSKKYGGTALFHDVTFDLKRGERVGLIGPNGIGKTTLLRIAMGEEPPTSGTVERGRITIGYFEQHQSHLAPGNTIVDELKNTVPEMTISELRSAAGRFLFSNDDAFKTVASLSGGEKARLSLAKIILRKPAFLVLDEPTNHLDIASRESVEAALREFNGTILMVTHDRYLLNRVIDRLLVFTGGRISSFPGTYRDYRASLAAERTDEEEKAAQSSEKSHSKDARFRREQKERQREKRRRERRLAAVHDTIEALEKRHAEIMEAFKTPEVYNNPERSRELTAETKKLESKLAEAYKTWEELEG